MSASTAVIAVFEVSASGMLPSGHLRHFCPVTPEIVSWLPRPGLGLYCRQAGSSGGQAGCYIRPEKARQCRALVGKPDGWLAHSNVQIY